MILKHFLRHFEIWTSKMAPKGINSEVPAGKFQRISKLASKGINSEVPVKAKMNIWEGISVKFQPQGRSKLAPKGNNSEVPAGKFQQRSELAPKGINFEVPAGEFCANGFWNSILGFKVWARGRVYQDLHGSLFFWDDKVKKNTDICYDYTESSI